MKKEHLYLNAIKFAIEWHEGQLDRYGNPYILHPLRVAAKFPNDLDCAIVAVCHDVKEDHAEVTDEDLYDIGLESKHVKAINLLTKKPNQSYEDYINNIVESLDVDFPIALMACKVKVADMEDNLSFTRSLTDIASSDIKLANKFVKYRRAYNTIREAFKMIGFDFFESSSFR